MGLLGVPSVVDVLGFGVGFIASAGDVVVTRGGGGGGNSGRDAWFSADGRKKTVQSTNSIKIQLRITVHFLSRVVESKFERNKPVDCRCNFDAITVCLK